MKKHTTKPDWLKVSYNKTDVDSVYSMMDELCLNTVCREGSCPNIGKCSKHKSATFMILGKNCTRNCRFCNVTCGKPEAVDPDEPHRLAQAVGRLGLSHVVVTSVTRDDLPDGGADQFAAVIREIRNVSDATIEVLIPDFLGDKASLDTVMKEAPDVLNHNVETVKELYSSVRPQAIYDRSLKVLKYCKNAYPESFTKTGFMVGLGESREQVFSLMEDISKAGCDILTIGQYLPPSADHAKLMEYVTPEKFEEYKNYALKLGFSDVVSEPLARSSYMAGEALKKAQRAKNSLH